MENHGYRFFHGSRQLCRQSAGAAAKVEMKRHLITFLFLVLAMALYAAGAAGPATFLLILGVLAEAVFWLRVSGQDKQFKKKSL